MGICNSKQATKQSSSQKIQAIEKNQSSTKQQIKKSKLSNIQKQLINKMYNDISQRCDNNIITRQSLEIFFHANGLMAELLFSKFDENKSGLIQQNDFEHAFQVMVKGSFEQKADVLFEFYNVDHSAGIRYGELLKILFSYPLPQLNKMIWEEKFLNYLGANMLNYYFGPQNKFQDRTILEDNNSENNNNNNQARVRKYSLFNYNNQESGNETPNNSLKNGEDDKKTKKIPVPDIFKKQNPMLASTQKDEGQSNKKSKKPPQLKSNIASITKRYATYLFVSLNLDKEKDVFSKQHFYKLMKDHPCIFDAHISGFHTYIWQIDAQGEPQYKKINPWVQNNALEIIDNKQEKVYIQFIRTTIFVFSHKKSNIPQDIITMEGLTVQGYDKDDKYGIKIKHRDGFYKEKIFMFDNISVKENWLNHLQHFKDHSIFDKYIKLERIGGGKFSNVFRGKDKKNDKFVAIKIIQHVKLQQIERQVIKRECGILKTCHHPNIVKFYEQFRTNAYLYIVTQLLSEGDLFEYTKKNCFLEEFQAAIIFKQLTQAILYLNEELGIIHRDLKPQNVMIITGEDSKIVRRVKLIDFGFGVFKDNLGSLTQKERFAGTPGFIAPQVYQYKDYDQKIDTFSLGIILYFMLYGYLPFQSNFTEQIQQMTLNCSISLRNNHWSNVSNEAKDLIIKILTPIQTRISTKQILQHPWLADIQKLKEYHGRNKRIRILF